MWQNTLRHLLPTTKGQRHKSSIKTGAGDVEEGDIWTINKNNINKSPISSTQILIIMRATNLNGRRSHYLPLCDWWLPSPREARTSPINFQPLCLCRNRKDHFLIPISCLFLFRFNMCTMQNNSFLILNKVGSLDIFLMTCQTRFRCTSAVDFLF